MNIDTLGLIAEFVNTPIYKLRLWIDENKINWDRLSGNPRAIHLLEKT